MDTNIHTMSFYTTFDGKVIFIRLSPELMEKPALCLACLEVIGIVVRNMTSKQSDKEGEGRDNIDDSLFEELIIEAIDDYTSEDDVSEQLTREYGMENAVELFDERSCCDSLEELVEEHGNRNGILAYHIIKQQIEREIGDDLLCDLVRHALRFIEGNEYEELDFQCMRY